MVALVASQVACVDDRSQVVDEIAEKDLEKLRAASLDPLMHHDDGGNAIINDVNLLNNNGGNRGRFNSNSGNFRNQGRRGDNRQHSSTRSSQQQQQSIKAMLGMLRWGRNNWDIVS